MPDGVKPDGVRLPRGGEEPPAEDWSGVHGTTVGVRGEAMRRACAGELLLNEARLEVSSVSCE